MNRRMRLFPFIILTIVVLLQLYAYFGMQPVLVQCSAGVQFIILSIFYTLFGLSLFSFFLVFYRGKLISTALRNFLLAAVFINLFSVLFFDLFVFLDDIRFIVLWIFQDNPTNSSYILISIGLIVAILPAFLLIMGMIFGPYRYKIRETVIYLPKLPDAFRDFKIIQISDIHSGSLYNVKAVNKGVDMILAQQADVIFFTGDLVNDHAEEMNPFLDTFSRIKAPMGVFSILGNHDYGDYTSWPTEKHKNENFERLKAIHGQIGWRLLLNEHLYLQKGNDKIALIGVENWGMGFHKMGDLKKAYQDSQADVKLLLSHDPTHWDEEITKFFTDIDITFSGHTHGAQMGFEWGKYRWSPIQLRYKKWAGLYSLKNQYLYINRGFGFLGYPGRLGIWPEISVITLKSDSN